MTNYLVLVDTPIRGTEAAQEFARLNSSPATFHLIVPTRDLTSGEHEFVNREETPSEEGLTDEVVAARWRLSQSMGTLRETGIADVTGSTTAPDPIDSIETALQTGEYDAVVVVTQPAGMSSWVHLDLPSRIERHVDNPVNVVEIDPAHV